MRVRVRVEAFPFPSRCKTYFRTWRLLRLFGVPGCVVEGVSNGAAGFGRRFDCIGRVMRSVSVVARGH